jgi:hypothetical protein
MAKAREAMPSFRDRMVYLISPVNLRVPSQQWRMNSIPQAAPGAR